MHKMMLGERFGIYQYKPALFGLIFILLILAFTFDDSLFPTTKSKWVKDSKQLHSFQTSYTNLTDITKRDGWVYYYTLIEIHDGYSYQDKTYFSSQGYSKVNCATGEHENLVWTLHSQPSAKGNSIEIKVASKDFLMKEYLESHPICSKI